MNARWNGTVGGLLLMLWAVGLETFAADSPRFAWCIPPPQETTNGIVVCLLDGTRHAREIVPFVSEVAAVARRPIALATLDFPTGERTAWLTQTPSVQTNLPPALSADRHRAVELRTLIRNWRQNSPVATWPHLFVGHSLAGLFLLETFADAPDFAEKALILDPSIWWPPGRLQRPLPAHRIHLAFARAPQNSPLAELQTDALRMFQASHPELAIDLFPDATHATILPLHIRELLLQSIRRLCEAYRPPLRLQHP
ncbi:MAG: hypothetical protein ACI4X9_01940 [Kiritimatiellia bacterium]